MAEDVIIQGFGDDRNFPDFATEQTQKQLLAAFKAVGLKGLKSDDLDKLITAIGKGDKDVSNILKSIKDTDSDGTKTLAQKLSDSNKKIDDLRKQNKAGDKARDVDAEETKKILSEFSGMMGNIRDGLKSGELGLGDATSGIASVLAAAGGGAAKLGGALIGLGAAVNGANQFMIGIGEDRFNLANEIRQSGLAASLSTAESGMINFAEMVNRTSFSLGQAAEFANKFSMAVGGAGIERSMQFVEDMAYGGAEGADMMRRFGLEFGGVANVAGQYLESVRNLGMLDRMNNQQLRSGMEEFMETVTVTSNIMKVNIQDAAEMIANTLNQRDDLTVMLAGLPNELRDRVTGIVSAMGAQGTQFGESISMALASTSFDEFLTTDQGQSLAGSNLGQEFIPLLRSVTDQIRAGAEQGDVLASMEGPLRAIVAQFGEDGFRTLIAQNQDPLIRALGADFVRILDNIGDANVGNRADTNQPGLEDDRTFVDRAMVQQEFVLAQENLLTQIGKAADYAENLAQRNVDNLSLINSVEEAGAQLIGSMGETVADITFGVESAFTRFTNAIASAGGSLLSFVSEDMALASELVQEQNRRAQEMLGVDPETIRKRAEEETNRKREEIERRNIESTVGDANDEANNYNMSTSPAIRREFNEDMVQSALSLGHEIVDYRTKDADGNDIIEKRINTNLAGGFGHAEYMPLTQAQFDTIMGESRITNELLGQVGEGAYEQLDNRFATNILNQLTDNYDSSEDIANEIANMLGITDKSKTFDLEGSERSQQELAFVTQAIEQLQNNASLSQEQVNQIVSAIENMDTKYRFGFSASENTARETSEKEALVGALQSLVRELQSN